MSAIGQMLVSPAQAADMIDNGMTLAIAADESILRSLPSGHWIGGSIPYFMGPQGGVTARDQVFVTPIPHFEGLAPRITHYDVATLSQVCVEAPDNGFSLIILPAFSDVHFDYAQNAAMYDDMFMKPVVGWVAGIHLQDLGKASPQVRDGRQAALLDNTAVVIHVPLPPHISANVNIVNLFQQGTGDALAFESSGFEASRCLVNGRPVSLAQYLKGIGHDSQLPLVANYNGAQVNVSIKAIDLAEDRVEFYGPVFPGMVYKTAQPFEGQYEAAFLQATAQLSAQASFSCNCILNYLYCGLDGKRTGQVTGPMTFGEVAYVLMNQTMVHLALETH